MKTLNQLINQEEPGWDIVEDILKNAKNTYQILPKTEDRAKKELLRLQVTTRSPMGAIVYETGGILVDHAWLRILGSGSKALDRGLCEWNMGKTIDANDKQPTHLLIADDVLGGYFAINAGGIGAEIGKIYYLAQDSLAWECLDTDYSGFLYWALNGDLEMYYHGYRWANWQKDVKQLDGNQVFSFYPFLWTKEGQSIENTTRKMVSATENYFLTLELQQKFFNQ